MNPPNPNPIAPFTFLSPNPNPNPNSPIPPPPQTPNISHAISTLQALIDQSTKTLTTLTNLTPSPHSHRLSHCPFDPRHRVPSESLFRHSFECRGGRGRPGIGPALLDTLHYPKTLKSDEELSKDDVFMRGSDELMCFSIDDYGGLGSNPNFFYKDCPSVVCCGELDECDNRVFTIPSVLYVHCVNVICDGCEEIKGFDWGRGRGRILPSEVWAVRREVEAWGDYPREYSFSVLRVALCLPMIREYDSVEWMISNSAHFGVVIDVAMSEHVYLLLKLCLKAVSYEARRSSKLYDGGVGDVNFRSIRFACPVLIDVMTWFATQLSVLYGEANAKLFSIEMLKHFISNGTIGELVGAIESKNVKIEETTVGSGKENLLGIENKRSDLVYVSQVAAAVAALHERSLNLLILVGMACILEFGLSFCDLGIRIYHTAHSMHIHAIVFSPQAYGTFKQISEHAYVTKKADEERKKRPNYRPILEYDGLLSHRSHNEDSRKMKTKEELLAEERDYKRRRMSYRGKKVKRSITEVMRDIIEEHMEEIKQAGGIGCFVKGSSEGVSFPSGSVSDHEMAADDKLRNLGFDSSETREMQMGHYHRSLSSNDSFASIENINLKDSRRREYSGRHESLDVQPRSIRKASERDREYRSRSPDNYRNHGHSHDRHGHQRERDKKKVTEYRYDENRRSRESRSSSISDLASDFSHRKNREMPRSEGRHRDRTFGTHRSDNMSPSSFDDRYDPSESCDRYDEDVSSGSKYARTGKSYKSK
ncbi:hypothetical protein Scep_010818 [Stephania cephalantha]|uniref:CHHC U11-48K-type domain-containing protein n=1 Tax=Stephania cephalantha TaxID=152367 RepID=A0AAP0JY86_9MAGN